MKLEVGVTYAVLKSDGSTITFKFIGGEPPYVSVSGENKLLLEILTGGYQAYWEVVDNI